MTTLGVFRDDFYNAINVLTNSQFKSISQASGVLAASALTGATECYISQSGATALTTDSAVNIVAALQSCLQAQLAALSLGSSTANYPNGVPNLVNLTYLLFIRNTNGGTLTLTAGAGVTITGVATLATTVERQYQVTITSPTTVTLQDLGGAVVT